MTEVTDVWELPFKPNGLQAMPDGLWVLEEVAGGQTDDHVYKLSYDDGSMLDMVPIGLGHAGGMTVGGGYTWVASDYQIYKLDREGNILQRQISPGGLGAHGLEWIDENNMWVVDPGRFTVDLVDPATMAIKRSVPTPVGKKAHDMFIGDGAIWQGITRPDYGGGEIYKIDIEDGTVLDHIHIPEPEVHGLAGYDGRLWFCCTTTNRVCTVPMPS